MNLINLKPKTFNLIVFLCAFLLGTHSYSQVEYSKNLKQSKDALIRENAKNKPIPNAKKLNVDGFFWAPAYKKRKMALIRFELDSAIP